MTMYENCKIATMWSNLVYLGIATEGELELITHINGYHIETLNDVLECRTGYKDMEQYFECEGE